MLRSHFNHIHFHQGQMLKLISMDHHLKVNRTKQKLFLPKTPTLIYKRDSLLAISLSLVRFKFLYQSLILWHCFVCLSLQFKFHFKFEYFNKIYNIYWIIILTDLNIYLLYWWKHLLEKCLECKIIRKNSITKSDFKIHLHKSTSNELSFPTQADLYKIAKHSFYKTDSDAILKHVFKKL